MRVQPLRWEDPLEKEIATHSSILAWKIPQTEEPGGLPSMGLQRDTTEVIQHARIPFPLSLPPPPSHPSRSSQSTKLTSLYQRASSHQLSILHVVVSSIFLFLEDQIYFSDKHSLCLSLQRRFVNNRAKGNSMFSNVSCFSLLKQTLYPSPPTSLKDSLIQMIWSKP